MLNNIQVLRALAALTVAISHLASLRPEMLSWLNHGVIGVDVFFVISGFIMVHISERGAADPVDFMRRRIVRIVPLYWLLTLAVFALAWLAPGLMGSTRADLVMLLKSLLFIPFSKSEGIVRPLLFQGWTLNVEMVFYLLFALSLTLRSLKKQVALLSAFLLTLVCWGALAQSRDVLAAFYTMPMLADFVAGMALGLFWRQLSLPVVAVMWGLFALALWGYLSDHQLILLYPLMTGSFALAAVASALLLERRGRSLDWPPLLALGAASYSLYLAHPFAAVAVEKTGRWLGLLEGGGLLAVMLISTAAMILTGVVVHRLIELPLDRAVRRWAGMHKGG